MDRKQLIKQLDTIAGSLSELAGEVNRIKIVLEVTPEGASKLKRALRNRQGWPKGHKARGVQLANDGQSAREIAVQLNRSSGQSSVLSMLSREMSTEDYQAWRKATERVA